MVPRRAAHASRRSQAFTLIELLVVICIIAILAAQLFPVFAKAREKALAIACVANVKQLDMAVLEYTMDYDEQFFGPGTGEQVWGDGRGWAERIQPYTKNRQILQCPEAEDEYQVTYLWNQALSGVMYGGLDDVTRTVLFYDGQTTKTDSNPNDGQLVLDLGRNQCGCLGLPSAPNHPEQAPRHNEGWNVAYADGHVKWTKQCGEGTGTGPTRLLN